MKLYLVISSEQYEGSYPIKVFRDETKAQLFVYTCQTEEDKLEYPTYSYYVREIEADLDE